MKYVLYKRLNPFGPTSRCAAGINALEVHEYLLNQVLFYKYMPLTCVLLFFEYNNLSFDDFYTGYFLMYGHPIKEKRTVVYLTSAIWDYAVLQGCARWG